MWIFAIDFDFPTSSGVNDEEMGMDMDDFPEDVPILSVGEEKDIGKTKIMKKILKEGEGWERPGKGDDVEGISVISFGIWSLSFG